MNVADDVVGGHGLRCLIMVAKIAVSWNMWRCCLMKGFQVELRFRYKNHKDMITMHIISSRTIFFVEDVVFLPIFAIS